MRKYVNVSNVDVHVGFIAMLFVIALLSSALALVYFTKTIDHQASIVTSGKIQAYSDAGCTQVLDSFDWGDFNATSADATKSLDFYIKNEGNVAVNATWVTSDFTFYNATDVGYEASSWRLYLMKVDGTEVKLRPENDTSPSNVHLTAQGVAHLRFYLVAIRNSSPETLTFQTSFNSKND